MIRQILAYYLIDGMSVGKIADALDIDRASVRGHLKDWGITLRPSTSGYALGRDPVCGAVRRAGYDSFHEYAQVMSLEPITKQASELSVSERPLSKVYDAYRKLLSSFRASGIVLPTSQLNGADLEQRTDGVPDSA